MKSKSPQASTACTPLLPRAGCGNGRLLLSLVLLVSSGFSAPSLRAVDINGGGYNGNFSGGNWSDTRNWDGNNPSPGGERNLFFGTAFVNDGNAGSATFNNDLTSYSGYRINFDNVANAPSFTLNGNAITLFDFGTGNDPAVINNAARLETINLGLTFSGGNGIALIQTNTAGGSLLFGGALAVNTGTQLRISGASGTTTTFNGVVSGGGNIVTSVGSSAMTVVYGAANTYTGDTFIDSGTLRFGTAASAVGSADSSTLRLGATTGANNATIVLATTAGEQTINSAINPRSGNTGALAINSQNTSGTNTLSGNFFLDSNLAVNSTSGGILLLGAASSANTISFQSTSGGRVLTLGGAGSMAINEAFTNVSNGASQLVVTGGTVTLAANNSGTGANLLLDSIQGGTLAISSANNLGSPVVTGSGYPDKVLFGTNSTSTTSTLLVNGTFAYGSTTANQILGFGINKTSAAANTAIINVSGANVFTLNGAISDFGTAANAGVLQKSGPGTLVLNATNTYTGSTVVNAGTLLVNGNQTSATGNVSVANSGTLGGTGIIGGVTTVASGGIITGATNGPSGNASAIGTLSFTKALTINGTYVADISSGTNTSDTLSLTGTSANGKLNVTGATLNLNGTISAGIGYVLATYASITGTFSTVNFNGGALPAGEYLVYGTNSLTLVPEPGTWAGGLLLVGTLGFSQRRRLRAGHSLRKSA